MYNQEFCNEFGIKVDQRYINRKNSKFGYIYTPDAVVFDIKNKIKQWGNKPGKYDYNHALTLASELKRSKPMHPSIQESYIITLKEIDPKNLTDWMNIATEILKKIAND